jgi:hypothetical protein
LAFGSETYDAAHFDLLRDKRDHDPSEILLVELFEAEDDPLSGDTFDHQYRPLTKARS